MKRIIHYENESIDITKYISDTLMKNNFREKDSIDNYELIEKTMLEYSLKKLNSWDIDINKIKDNEINNLNYILKLINDIIPNKLDRKSYFNQYVYAILYITGKINKQNSEIKWCELYLPKENRDIIINENNNIIKQIETNKNMDTYLLPKMLLTTLKNRSLYKEKVLIKKI